MAEKEKKVRNSENAIQRYFRGERDVVDADGWFDTGDLARIDAQGYITLHVHPSVSAVSEKTKQIDLGTIGNYRLPLASSSVNETDTMVRLQDGNIAAIGGLMSQERREDSTAVPGLGELPVVGGLFRQKSTSMRKRELVILLKPTVIGDDVWPESPTLPAVARLGTSSKSV